jgi:hypothetical protein
MNGPLGPKFTFRFWGDGLAVCHMDRLLMLCCQNIAGVWPRRLRYSQGGYLSFPPRYFHSPDRVGTWKRIRRAPSVDVEGRTLGAKFSGAPFPRL